MPPWNIDSPIIPNRRFWPSMISGLNKKIFWHVEPRISAYKHVNQIPTKFVDIPGLSSSCSSSNFGDPQHLALSPVFHQNKKVPQFGYIYLNLSSAILGNSTFFRHFGVAGTPARRARPPPRPKSLIFFHIVKEQTSTFH